MDQTHRIRSHVSELNISMGGALHGVLGTSSDNALVMFEGIAVFARMLSRCSWTGLCVGMKQMCIIL